MEAVSIFLFVMFWFVLDDKGKWIVCGLFSLLFILFAILTSY